MTARLAAAAFVIVLVTGAARPARSDTPAASAEVAPLPNANDLVRSMIDRQRSFEKALDEYTYDVVRTEIQLDDKHRPKERHVRRYEIFFVDGAPVRRLVEEDGRPLSGEKAEKERKRALKAAEKARSRQRSEKQRAEDELRLSEILARFDFTTVGREIVDGRPTFLVSFRAQPGKRDIKHDNVLRAVQGRLWIDVDDRAVVRARLSTNQSIKVAAGLLASISKVDLDVEFAPVDAIWLPRRSQSFATGRLLFKGFRRSLSEEFSNYRRFTVTTEETAVKPQR